MGPVYLAFYNFTKLGAAYNKLILTSDVNTGFIYNFKLTENRAALQLFGTIQHKIAGKKRELSRVILDAGIGL